MNIQTFLYRHRSLGQKSRTGQDSQHYRSTYCFHKVSSGKDDLHACLSYLGSIIRDRPKSVPESSGLQKVLNVYQEWTTFGYLFRGSGKNRVKRQNVPQVLFQDQTLGSVVQIYVIFSIGLPSV
jgi:hypothetical protein